MENNTIKEILKESIKTTHNSMFALAAGSLQI